MFLMSLCFRLGMWVDTERSYKMAKTPGIIATKDGRWRIDKSYNGKRFQGRFETCKAAEEWLIEQIQQVRQFEFKRPSYL